MRVEHCPVLGDFCVTTYSRPHFDSENPLYPKEIIMSQTVSTDTTAAIYSLDAHIQSLQEAGRALRRLGGHPSASTLIGIRSEAIQNLEVVSVRLEKKQRDCFNPPLETAAKNEAEIAQQMLKRMEPLATLARNKELTAEALVEAIYKEPDPALARLQFMAHGKNLATVFDDNRVLMVPTTTALPTHYNATKPYRLRIKVSEFNAQARTATFALIEALGEQPFFRDHEHNRHISATIQDKHDRILVGLCASFGIKASVSMALNLDLGKKGFQFGGTLISFVDEAELNRDIRHAMMEQTMELFEATNGE